MNTNLRVEGGILPSPNLRVLELDLSVHQQSQLGQSSHAHTHQNFPRNHEDQAIGFVEPKFLSPRVPCSETFGKGKASATLINAMIDGSKDMSDEEDTEEGIGKKGSSPWQRMKWTDSRIRLLIQVVGCVGDDGSLEGVDAKRRSGSLQKKGKWKMVSKVMIGKGCHVSPQQCEDKFNDLNKRYKRLNDILGRGTSCRVVENPSLMDSMPQLSPKMKEDVKKILSSKHLFYPEMCAYHNGQKIPNCGELDLQDQPLSIMQSPKESNGGSEGEEAGVNNESEDEESEHEVDDNGGEDVEMTRGWNTEEGKQNFRAEVDEFLQDPKNSKLQKREFVKKRLLQLEERQVHIQADAFELEKRRFKWQRFCSNKDRELEISRLENERSMLENQRMALKLKQMEQEVDFNCSWPSLNPTLLTIDISQVRAQTDLGRHHQ